MTATVKSPDQVTEPPAHATPAITERWSPLALAAICAVAAVLYAWRIGTEGWGNPYYSAAVKSMSASLTNFVFGSFDPLGVVTVDKPPMALWPMVASALLAGGDNRPGRTSRGGVSTQRTQWVRQHCAIVNPDTYGSSTATRSNTTGSSDRADVLYDCQAH